MQTAEHNLSISQQDSTLLIRFARPEKKNALTLEMYEAATKWLQKASADPAIKSVIFASTSQDFTAGNDLKDFLQNPPNGEDAPAFRFMTTIANYEKPLIAAVDGLAVGIGFTMLLHCDFVYLTERSRLSAPFVNLGLVPEAGSSLLLPTLIGHRRAAEVLLLGEAISAQQAVDFNIANAIVAADELEAKALEIARRIADKPPGVVALTKKLMKNHAALQQQIAREARLFVSQFHAPDTKEALAAVLEKRKANFAKE